MADANANALYVSLDDAVRTITSIRQQAAGGGTFKPMTADALKVQLGGKLILKDIGSGKKLCVLRQELEKILSRERTAKFTASGGFRIVKAPTVGNGKKPGSRPTGS